jgi:type I site-specific restriction endonuclease
MRDLSVRNQHPKGGRMKDDDREKMRKHLRTIDAKISQKLDQNLSQVRNEYQAWSKEDRSAFRKWIEAMSSIEQPVCVVPVSAKVHVLTSDEGSVYANVRTLAMAINDWDENRDFIPKSLRDL